MLFRSRRVPEEIGSALGIAPAEPVCAIKCHWSVNGSPAAISTTYVVGAAASQDGNLADGIAGSQAGVPAALYLEMQPPPSSVARALRLAAGQPAATLTVRFDDPATEGPVALTVAALRPDLFRIVIESAAVTA